MKLRLLKILSILLAKAATKLLSWHEEVEWKITANTPVGPNPHEKGTLNWHLYENGNRLTASFRLRGVNTQNPWIELIKKGPHA